MINDYEQAKDGEWVWPIRRGWQLQCCDCGLTHRVNFRIKNGGKGRGALGVQFFRDDGETEKARKILRTDQIREITDRLNKLRKRKGGRMIPT